MDPQVAQDDGKRLSSFDEVDVRVLSKLVEDDPASVGRDVEDAAFGAEADVRERTPALVARSSIQNSTFPVLAT